MVARVGDIPAQPEIELDPAVAERRRAERARRLHVVEIPTLRTIGFGIILLLVIFHNQYILGAISWPAVGALGGGAS